MVTEALAAESAELAMVHRVVDPGPAEAADPLLHALLQLLVRGAGLPGQRGVGRGLRVVVLVAWVAEEQQSEHAQLEETPGHDEEAVKVVLPQALARKGRRLGPQEQRVLNRYHRSGLRLQPPLPPELPAASETVFQTQGEHQADQPGADKWIVLIFFMMGLSIGVHLLNLLTIPAIVMIYYFIHCREMAGTNGQHKTHLGQLAGSFTAVVKSLIRREPSV